MDIVERSKPASLLKGTLLANALSENERLRQQLEFERGSFQQAILELGKLDTKVERLQSALQAVVDAHGTGQGIGAQGVGSWLDQARQALEDK